MGIGYFQKKRWLPKTHQKTINKSPRRKDRTQNPPRDLNDLKKNMLHELKVAFQLFLATKSVLFGDRRIQGKLLFFFRIIFKGCFFFFCEDIRG